MRLWLICVAVSLALTALSYWGLGGLVHHWFYVRRRDRAVDWKLQPARWPSAEQARHALLLGSANILMGAIAGGSFAWYVASGGWSRLYFDVRAWPLAWLPASAIVLFVAVDAGLYYSHRLLHHRALFRHVHRWHHRFVAPTLFTTTAVHPIEFLVFEAVLIAPALIVPVHVGVYVVVIAYTYLIGMIDHSGIRLRWRLPLHADNRFHDDHHVYFHCNYSHHTTLFDRLHGTLRSDEIARDEE
jgi:lathosterol oxidase